MPRMERLQRSIAARGQNPANAGLVNGHRPRRGRGPRVTYSAYPPASIVCSAIFRRSENVFTRSSE